MRTLVLIPAYNEEESLLSTVSELTKVCPELDYLVINDCSADLTAQICDNSNLKHLDLCCNLGIGGSVQAGYLYALTHNYDCAIQLDADGQHDPRYISQMTKLIENGTADLVIGSRFLSSEGFHSTVLRRCGISFLSWLIYSMTGQRILDVTSGFRAANRKLISFFAENYADDYPEPESIVQASIAGAKIAEAPVVMRARNGGHSSINLLRSVYYIIKVSLAILLSKITYNGGYLK